MEKQHNCCLGLTHLQLPGWRKGHGSPLLLPLSLHIHALFQIEKLITLPSPYSLPCGQLMEIFLYANTFESSFLTSCSCSSPTKQEFHVHCGTCHQETRFCPKIHGLPVILPTQIHTLPLLCLFCETVHILQIQSRIIPFF